MSLITCKECNAQISETAESCPKCGAKKPKGPLKTIAIIIAGVVVVFIAAVLLTPESREQKAFNRSLENLENATDKVRDLNR
jgi:uncharacterized paraquat-inducible protein A